MATATSEARLRPLIDVLGRTWSMDLPVLAAVFNRTGSIAAFTLEGGDLVLARCDGDDVPGAQDQPKSDGTIEITPQNRPPAPLTHVRTSAGHNIPLVADIQDGFLGGEQNGRLFLVAHDGQLNGLSSFDKPIHCVATAPDNGFRACAVGREIYLYGVKEGNAHVAFQLEQPASALAFDARGEHLAAAHGDGLALWNTDNPSAAPKTLRWPGQHKVIAWSPDNCFIASCVGENTIHVWRLQDGAEFNTAALAASPTCLSWARQSQFLVSDGDARVACWPMIAADQDTPLRAEKTGIPSEILVTCAACHPHNDTIAAGYANGAVLLCRHGQGGELFVKGLGDGAVKTIGWSADGRHLAFGTQQGFVAVVSFPAGFFK